MEEAANKPRLPRPHQHRHAMDPNPKLDRGSSMRSKSTTEPPTRPKPAYTENEHRRLACRRHEAQCATSFDECRSVDSSLAPASATAPPVRHECRIRYDDIVSLPVFGQQGLVRTQLFRQHSSAVRCERSDHNRRQRPVGLPRDTCHGDAQDRRKYAACLLGDVRTHRHRYGLLVRRFDYGHARRDDRPRLHRRRRLGSR